MEPWQPRLTFEGTCDLLGVSFEDVERPLLFEKMKELESKHITEMWNEHGRKGLSFYRVTTLKEELGKLELKKSGRKDALVTRLDEAFRQKNDEPKRKRETIHNDKENEHNQTYSQSQKRTRSNNISIETPPTKIPNNKATTFYYTFDVTLEGHKCSRRISAAFDDLTFNEIMELVLESFSFDSCHQYCAYLPDGKLVVKHPTTNLLVGELFGEVSKILISGTSVTLKDLKLTESDVVNVLYDFTTKWQFNMVFKERMLGYKSDGGVFMLLASNGSNPPQYIS